MAAWVTWVAPSQSAVDLREHLPKIGGRLALPWAQLRVLRGGPWAPSEIFERAPLEPALEFWVLESRDPRGRLLSPRAHDSLVYAPMGPVARGGEAWDTEILAPLASQVLGAVLVLAHMDHPQLSYAAEYREGSLRWSLCVRQVQGRWHTTRSDGEGVSARETARAPFERTQVLLRGLERLTRTHIEPADNEKLAIPEILAECVLEARQAPAK